VINEERYERLVANHARAEVGRHLSSLTPAAWREAVEDLERSADRLPEAGAGAFQTLPPDGYALARRLWETHQGAVPNPGVDLELGAYLLPTLLVFASDGDTFSTRISQVSDTLAWAVSLTSGRWGLRRRAAVAAERAAQCDLLRDLFGNPFRPAWLLADWASPQAEAIARAAYEDRDFESLPILADALEDAGCDDEEILTHCRAGGEHVRGCWAVDLVLGKC
jgi:hypothetical protein